MSTTATTEFEQTLALRIHAFAPESTSETIRNRLLQVDERLAAIEAQDPGERTGHVRHLVSEINDLITEHDRLGRRLQFLEGVDSQWEPSPLAATDDAALAAELIGHLSRAMDSGFASWCLGVARNRLGADQNELTATQKRLETIYPDGFSE
jgi:hypothetical protein